MHIGVDSFVSEVTDPKTDHVVGPAERMAHLLEEIALADRVGLYSFGIGEHHRHEYYDSAPQVILAAAAARTERIRLGSAVKVLSADDPVRVFQQFATLDLISGGRVDLVVGRGSFTESFPLFGLDLADYDALFEEKLELLLQLRDNVEVTLIDLYRRAGAHAGHAPEQLQVGLHVFGYVGESTQAAADTIYPGWHKMFTTVSRERGFAPPSRPQFDATAGPDGAFFMGDPQTVADKIRRISEQVGGVDRLSLQMTNPLLAHDDLLRGIDLLGTEVAPLVADV
jgi:alkanesulfonate monooxygenase SsuD/methylene tetrahydromethanopterin reductase-like flavin-dependent oxidoreductase (luciferase family)